MIKDFRSLRPDALAVVALVLSLTACGREGPKPATQVAARVNSDEITVHQVNDALGAARVNDPAQIKQASRQILERLIDEDLLMRKAIDTKLDRDPTVVTAIDTARRRLLAQAYLDSVMRTTPPPTDDEVKKFYTDHPELFSERHVYRLAEIQIQANPDQRKLVASKMATNPSWEELPVWLKAQNLVSTTENAVRAAEQLPMALVPKLKDGQTIAVETPAGVTLTHVVTSELQPLTEDRAAKYIEQFLLNMKRRAAAENEVKTLRTAAKVDYMGEFAGGGPAAAASPLPAASAQGAAGSVSGPGGPAAGASTPSPTSGSLVPATPGDSVK